MNDDTLDELDAPKSFDGKLRRLAFALDEASHLLLAQTSTERAVDELPPLRDLDGIQAIVDDAAGQLAAFDEHLEIVQRQAGKDFSPPEFEMELTDEELEAVFPQTASAQDSDPKHDIIHLQPASHIQDHDMDERQSGNEFDTSNGHVATHAPDRESSWASRLGDRGGRSIE